MIMDRSAFLAINKSLGDASTYCSTYISELRNGLFIATWESLFTITEILGPASLLPIYAAVEKIEYRCISICQ
jgi:hypothetical protein